MRIAAWKAHTGSFGKSVKSAVWFQGCPRSCPGCIAPQWQDMDGGRQIGKGQVAAFLSKAGTRGLVISGGEPLVQYYDVLDLMACAGKNEMGIILYTGFSYQEIEMNFNRVLELCDVVICGPYLEKQNRGRGLRGSENQRVLFLTDRYITEKEAFLFGPRTLEVDVNMDGLFFCGIPPLKTRTLVSGEI